MRRLKCYRRLAVCALLTSYLSAALQDGMITVQASLISVQELNNVTVDPSIAFTFESMITPTPELTPEPIVTPTPIVAPEPFITPGPNITPEPIVTPTPIVRPEPSITPGPNTPEPIVTPTPIVAPEPSITPGPNKTPEPTVTPEPTKTPEKFIPSTLKTMKEYDYINNSVTGISKKKASVKVLQKSLDRYGKLYGTGMPWEEYQEAMTYEWEDATDYKGKPVKINVDLTKTMDYQAYVSTLKKMSRYDGVYLYRIGESTQGRDLYAIEIDVDSKCKKNVIMLTGQVHAREFAGGTYIVKQFVDLIQKAQTDQKTMELLKSNKFVAVPIINVDGREELIKHTSKWTKGGELWKAYTNGTDGNRNFPGLQWGQLLKGYNRKAIIEDKPGYANYPGDYAGSNNETKALMKWIYHYTVVEQANLYLDMHQQGSVLYAGKGWLTKKQDQRSKDFRTELLNIINKGNHSRSYIRINEDNGPCGLRGEGSSLTDYAMSLAAGAKFSPAYGFLTFTDGKKEYILMEVKDLDQSKIKFKPANSKLATSTIEIGYGRSYLGNSSKTRELLNNEYTRYHFNKLLEALPGSLD